MSLGAKAQEYNSIFKDKPTIISVLEGAYINEGSPVASVFLQSLIVLFRHYSTINFGLQIFLVILALCFSLHKHYLFWLEHLDCGEGHGHSSKSGQGGCDCCRVEG